MISEQMKAEGWIEHDGGPCPVPLDSRPGVILENGWTQSPNYNLKARLFRWQSSEPYDAGLVRAYKPEGTSHDH